MPMRAYRASRAAFKSSVGDAGAHVAGNLTLWMVGSAAVTAVAMLLLWQGVDWGGLVGHIEDVAVHRDYQQQGLGSALVRHATEEARQRGCYKVILNCYERLVPFYCRLGYRPHDTGLRIDW